MYLRDLLLSLRRRWILLGVAVLLTAGAGLLTASATSPTYQMTSSVLLVPPKSTDDPGANRYLALANLGQAVSVVVRDLNSEATNQAVDRSAPVGDYVAAPDPTSSAPIVVVTATAGSAEQAKALITAVNARVPRSLTSLQQALRIKESNRITAVKLTQDLRPTVMQKKRIRLIAAQSVLLLGALVLAIGALDGVRRRRVGGGDDRGDDPEGRSPDHNPDAHHPAGPHRIPAPISSGSKRRRPPPRTTGAARDSTQKGFPAGNQSA